VQLADEYEFGIVFYISPLNSAFLDTVNLKDPASANCLGQIDGYMGGLVREHANIRYLDLLSYPRISDLREDGFVDVMHLNKAASTQLVDVLMPDISAVVQWATAARADR
jgi:hypothetical protein